MVTTVYYTCNSWQYIRSSLYDILILSKLKVKYEHFRFLHDVRYNDGNIHIYSAEMLPLSSIGKMI